MLFSLKPFLERRFSLIIFLISFALSPWIYYSWRGLNSDGILYIQLAYIINTLDLNIALQNYDWPFFSAIIATTHNITHLSYIASAYLLDALFMGFSALFFIEIIKKTGGGMRVQWLAALVFLSFETIINYRVNIFRDPGYWAFYLSAFYFFLCFAETLSMKDGLLWFFSSITAILFRIEGIILLALTPFALFFFSGFSIRQKVVMYLKLYLPLIFLLLFSGIILSFYEKKVFFIILNIIKAVIHTHIGTISFLQNFKNRVNLFNNTILPSTAKQGSAFIILFSGLTCYFIYKFILSLGFLNSFLLLGLRGKKIIPFRKNQKLVFIWIFIVSLLLPYNFILQTEFINTRYLVSSTLIALFLVPFVLDYCLEHPQLSWRSFFCTKAIPLKKRSIFTLKTLFIIYLISALGSFIFLFTEEYYQNMHSANLQANIWLSANRQHLPDLCSTNSWPVFAVAEEKIENSRVDSTIKSFLYPQSACQYIVLVGKASRNDRLQILQNSPNWRLYKIFTDSRSSRNVYVFQRVKQELAS